MLRLVDTRLTANPTSLRLWHTAAGLLLLAFLLVYLKPYHGIRHDSILYLGQALLRWQPDQFANDLFFAYGGQTDYTVFPWLMAWLLRHFNAAELFLTMTWIGLAGFVIASFALIQALFPAAYRYYALLALVLLPTGYGGHHVFSYAEPFFTGRSLAEPLALASLAAWLGGRRILAIVCGVAAFLIHPLQSLVLPLLAYGALIWRDRRWLHLLWLALPLAVIDAGNGDSSLAGRWLAHFDDEWYQWVVKVNSDTLLFHWQIADWGPWLTDLFLGWLIVQRASGRLQSLARAAVLAMILGMLATLVLADFSHNVLATGLQLWRAQWLLHWLAMACVPWLLIEQYRAERGMRPRFALLLAIIVIGAPMRIMGAASLAVAFMIPLYLGWPRLAAKVSRPVGWLMRVFPYALLVLALAKYGLAVGTTLEKVGGAREAARWEFMAFSHPLVAGGCVLGALWLWLRVERARPALLVILLLLLIHAVNEWDRRSTWTRYIESAQYSPDRFGVEIAPAAQVFWEGELLAPWLVLNRPSYFSGFQSAGILFSRRTAEEVFRRHQRMQPYIVQRGICQVLNEFAQSSGWIPQSSSAPSCWVDTEVIKDICAPGGPDYLVLEEKLQAPALGRWSIVGGIKGDKPISYWLYRCSDLVSTGDT